MPDDYGEGNETAPPVTSQPIPGPQEPETGSREPATKSAPRRRRFVSGALNVLVAVVVVWLLSATWFSRLSGGTTSTSPAANMLPRSRGPPRESPATRSTSA